ncbi:MAG: hypothetical protein [Olavius algarvensis Delta 4 endosymbiont]|nr:MAG: hypothetical protein [Olavius algarvensis Delta 4 endosymbiont]
MINYVDLYRQMLWDAKKVEDKKLARLVQERISPYLKPSLERCNKIIPFPTAPVEEKYLYPEDN